MCHYTGMLATGIRAVDAAGTPGLNLPTPAQPTEDRWQLDGTQITHYVEIPGSGGVRCLWVFKEDGDPRPRLQTVSFQLRGELADQETTLSGLIDSSISMATDFGQSQGQELPTLITPCPCRCCSTPPPPTPNSTGRLPNTSPGRTTSRSPRSATSDGAPERPCANTASHPPATPTKQLSPPMPAVVPLRAAGDAYPHTSARPTGTASASRNATPTARSSAPCTAPKESTGTTSSAGTHPHPSTPTTEPTPPCATRSRETAVRQGCKLELEPGRCARQLTATDGDVMSITSVSIRTDEPPEQ